MPESERPTPTQRLIVLLSVGALAIGALTAAAVVPEDNETKTVSAAASEPVPFQETPSTSPQEDQALRLAPTTTAPPPPPTTTTQPPTTTTTHYHPPTTQPPTTEPPAPVQQASGASGDPYSDASWDRLAQCESGGNWSINTGNGYYGGIQFSLSSWQAVGGTGYPHEQSRSEQMHRGRLLWEQGGWAHWPGCTRSFGWR